MVFQGLDTDLEAGRSSHIHTQRSQSRLVCERWSNEEVNWQSDDARHNWIQVLDTVDSYDEPSTNLPRPAHVAVSEHVKKRLTGSHVARTQESDASGTEDDSSQRLKRPFCFSSGLVTRNLTVSQRECLTCSRMKIHCGHMCLCVHPQTMGPKYKHHTTESSAVQTKVCIPGWKNWPIPLANEKMFIFFLKADL